MSSPLDDPAVEIAAALPKENELKEFSIINLKPDQLEFQNIVHSGPKLIDDQDPKSDDLDALLPTSSSGSSNIRIPPSSIEQSSSSPAFYTLEFWQSYFDISTVQFVHRLLRAFMPHRNFFTDSDSKPDLYGPFWISTTLVFLVAAMGNFANYLAFFPTSKSPEWRLDIQKVSTAATMLYGAVFVLPCILYFVFSRYLERQATSLIYLISIYGYSLVVFIPTSIICVAPSELLRWLVVVIALCFSMTFILRNIWSYVPQQNLHPKGYFVLGGIALAQLGLAVAMKLYFFEYAAIAPSK
eukprot:TRINITY_DN1979_c0_g2_i2.p1 TRINITY_DN1979_c0_g2~~TRINITY_DN1979_c0_g2_i2.p1  ORF type:complete len:328 (+),score=70.64 TRINITY_DN1979_c0_g2_i2:92-985(+)